MKPGDIPMDTYQSLFFPPEFLVREGAEFSLDGYTFRIQYLGMEQVVGFSCTTSGYRHKHYMMAPNEKNPLRWNLCRDLLHQEEKYTERKRKQGKEDHA